MADPIATVAAAGTAISRRANIVRRLVKQATGTMRLDPGPGVDRFDLAPGETLLLGDPAAPLPEAAYDEQAGTLVVDLSAAQIAFRLAGPAARRLVAKGAAIDLDDRHFRVGAGTYCRFGAFRVLLHRVAADCFDLHVDRSLGDALLRYLLDLGAEFGVVFAE